MAAPNSAVAKTCLNVIAGLLLRAMRSLRSFGNPAEMIVNLSNEPRAFSMALHPTNGSLAIVTGTSSGLGAEIAKCLAERGFNILSIARRTERLEILKQELEEKYGIQVFSLPLDISQSDAIDQIERELERIAMPLKWLVNNAGYGMIGRFDTFQWLEHEKFMRVLAGLPIELTHRLLPKLKQAAPAHILNITSIAAFLPGTSGAGLYPGIKSLLFRFTECLAAELKYADITATASCPGYTDTEIFNQAKADGIDISFMDHYPSMPASLVARQAVEAAENGQVSVIHGKFNKAISILFRYAPLSLARWMGRMNESRNAEIAR